jgi:hypothetical protein
VQTLTSLGVPLGICGKNRKSFRDMSTLKADIALYLLPITTLLGRLRKMLRTSKTRVMLNANYVIAGGKLVANPLTVLLGNLMKDRA